MLEGEKWRAVNILIHADRGTDVGGWRRIMSKLYNGANGYNGEGVQEILMKIMTWKWQRRRRQWWWWWR